MTAQELINDLIPPLKSGDTVSKALGWMDGFRLSQLAWVENNRYMGIVTEDMLFELQDPQAKISSVEPELADVFVYGNQHFFDVFKVADAAGLRIVAVLNEQNEFEGVISVKDTISVLAKTFATQSPGGILVLSMDYYDYSLTHISRLIEENDAKILSAHVENDPYNPKKIKLTLKLNIIDLTRVLATLERFDYRVIAKFDDAPTFNLEQERLDLLFKYLDL
ncbi:MAG: CBS domain-containing protein [Bernardetiaceae bacterium]|nr:CBS domain-containing protein [Bernardetiaceae bacterium]